MSVSRLKKTTREDLVAKKRSFPSKKDDEIKREFLAQN
ncbi:hypothetical protein B4166_2140 [Caldibacillus thermoamylovorans]|uniref:Uncharacterized protein n=1 Tax=Caldibacillus thermoamylovorans TaxID=35841 RepID=A0ABD4AAS8_9BACI|nr:hypothetical protein B4166_2140 [Caldibacillus thermoamylovorans]KIO73417.1 hypothetical protein B4167_2140 [Caldibacillus thermoamylovorans]